MDPNRRRGRIATDITRASSRHLTDPSHQFDLPEVVRTRIGDPDDPVDVVRAILEAAGLACEIDGDLIRVGESALVILRTSGGVVIGHEARITRTSASSGAGLKEGWCRARLRIRERSSDGRCWLHRSSTPGPTGSSAWPMRCRSVLTLSASLSRSLSAPGDPVGLPEGTSRATGDRAAGDIRTPAIHCLAELVQAPKGQCLNGGVSGPLKREREPDRWS